MDNEGKRDTLQTINNNILIGDWQNQLELVKNITAKNCSPEEFQLFIYTANLYGLNPLKKEIWAVKYEGRPALIFCGRDGFLTISHRTLGIDKQTLFNGMETTFTEDDKHQLLSATCTVYRKDMTNPFKCTVYLQEFNKSSNPLWFSKPRVMLQKVAESFTLRRAFNVSNLYSPEEIDEVTQVVPLQKAKIVEVTGVGNV